MLVGVSTIGNILPMRALQTRVLEADLDGVRGPVRTRVMVFRLLVALGGRLRTLMDRRLEATGITTQQAACLTIAAAAEKPLAQGELARALGVSHQNVRQLITALERKGLVHVEADEDDRRTKRIRPARAAKKIFERRNAADYDVVAGWFAGLDDASADDLLRLLMCVARDLPRSGSEK